MNDLFPGSIAVAIESGQAISFDTKEIYKIAEKWNVEVWNQSYEYPNIFRFDSESEARECLNAMIGRDVSK